MYTVSEKPVVSILRVEKPTQMMEAAGCSDFPTELHSVTSQKIVDIKMFRVILVIISGE
jgi:hypothetical protein